MNINFERWNPENQFDENILGLWIFNIEEKDICFWGHYKEVLKNLEEFITKKKLEDKIVYVLDCIQYNRFFKEEKLAK